MALCCAIFHFPSEMDFSGFTDMEIINYGADYFETLIDGFDRLVDYSQVRVFRNRRVVVYPIIL